MRRVTTGLAASLLLTAGLSVGAGPASAAGVTLLVAKGGSDTGNCQVTACATVSYALTQAPAGATISVGKGTFAERELIPEGPVTIEGAGAGDTVIDATTADMTCAGFAIYLVGTGACGTPGLTAGTYALEHLTLEGTGGASASAEPILINIESLPAGSSVELSHVDFVTNSTIDPNLDDDFAVGVYAAGAEKTVEMNLSDDSFTGFYQAVFLEAFAGQAAVSGSTFADLRPSDYSGSAYPPIGVFLLSDGSAQGNSDMGGPFSLSDSTFTGYDGYGVVAQAGFAAANLTGSLSDVSISGNTFDLPAALDPATSGLSSPIALVSDGTSDPLGGVQISGNSLTTSGAGSADVKVTGPTTAANITGVVIAGNDLLGGKSVVGVGNQSGSTIGAVGNYWGDLMGPSGTGSGSGTQAPKGLDFSRWCTTPTPSCPSVPASPATVSASDPPDQAQVSWTVPPTDGDQSITSYTVTAHDETLQTSGPTESVPAADLSAVISGLTAGDTYMFTVSAVNLIGTGIATDSNPVTIPEAAVTAATTTATTTPATVVPEVTATALPATGADLSPELLEAAGALGLGAGLVVLARTRRGSQARKLKTGSRPGS